jgi:hypothetical protein
MAPLSVTIIYNKANNYGLEEDARMIDRVLKQVQISVGSIGKPKYVDMREGLTHSDIHFHLEIPVFSAIPWAYTNIMLVNPEQWSYAYDEYVHAFDALLFRDNASAEQFREQLAAKGLRHDHIYVIPWAASWQVKDIKDTYGKTSDFGFVAFLAGSTSKYEYMKKLLPVWKETDPALRIYTTRNDFAEDLKKVTTASNVVIKCQELDEDSRYRLMTLYRGHLVCSQGEAYGYAAANAEVAGAFTIMNRLPVLEEMYQGSASASASASAAEGVYWLSNSYENSSRVRYAMASPTDTARAELEEALEAFRTADFEAIRAARQAKAQKRITSSCEAFVPLMQRIQGLVKERQPKKGVFHCPPVLNMADCPPITVVTPTYNRKELIDIAFHNLLATDYPHDKIEWIVIEDNEKTPHLASEKIISFQIQVPKIKIKYIPIEGRMTIGEKRNHAVEQASHDIILFMDDDDHYPSTSFRRRVAWLTKGTKSGKTGEATIACCTTIALYDLQRGVSAVNVPPFDLPLSQRISEATLTFYKSAWLERKFPNVSLAEGESWIHGREDQVIEMPPQQIIVAFSHGKNQSSRRIPATDLKPACFWGFPKEYLVFIHKLAGVEVEEEGGKQPRKKK